MAGNRSVEVDTTRDGDEDTVICNSILETGEFVRKVTLGPELEAEIKEAHLAYDNKTKLTEKQEGLLYQEDLLRQERVVPQDVFVREERLHQEQYEAEKVAFDALPRYRIVLNSTENELLSTVQRNEVPGLPELCQICQSGLLEDPREPGKSGDTSKEQLEPIRVSRLKCNCRRMFHFDCISHFLRNPVEREGFGIPSCPHCRSRFRIEWIN